MAAGANLATTISSVLCFAYLFMYYISTRNVIKKEIKESVNYKYKSRRNIIKEIFKVSIPMSLVPILGTLNKNIDSITVVRGLKKFMEEGLATKEYGILSGKVDTLITLPMSFNIALMTALIPEISSSRAIGDMEKVKKRIEFSLLITILIGMPCMVGMIVFANPILKLLFPNQESGAFILQISSLSIIFIVIEQTVTSVLHGIGKTIIPAIALSIGVIVKLILNIILVPINPEKFILGGTVGAAFSTVICHMIALTIDWYIMNKNLKLKIKIKDYFIKPIIATSIMIIFTKFIYNYFSFIFIDKINIIISIIVSIIIYISMVFILKVFSKNNINMLPYGGKLYNILKNIGIYKEKLK